MSFLVNKKGLLAIKRNRPTKVLFYKAETCLHIPQSHSVCSFENRDHAKKFPRNPVLGLLAERPVPGRLTVSHKKQVISLE